MNKFVRDLAPPFLFMVIMFASLFSFVGAQTPPANNTIEQNVGITFNTVHALRDFWFRNTNLTDLFVNITAALENVTWPVWVAEVTVDWGLVYGTTGDWFNHSLPGEPIYIGLQMHPDNLTIGGEYLLPNVYDKTATQWQLELFWLNGTQCSKDCLVMYHMRWEPPVNGQDVDPNEPQLPNQEPV